MSQLYGKQFRFKWRFLDRQLFPNGWIYSNYPPDKRPRSPVIVHVNWITGHDSKIHRLRENLMWIVDPDEYYNFADRRYVTYSNTDAGVTTLEQQTELLLDALEFALASKRTLILPRFRTFGWSALPNVESCTFETLYEVDNGMSTVST
jgi:hypothetical protein